MSYTSFGPSEDTPYTPCNNPFNSSVGSVTDRTTKQLSLGCHPLSKKVRLDQECVSVCIEFSKHLFMKGKNVQCTGVQKTKDKVLCSDQHRMFGLKYWVTKRQVAPDVPIPLGDSLQKGGTNTEFPSLRSAYGTFVGRSVGPNTPRSDPRVRHPVFRRLRSRQGRPLVAGASGRTPVRE